MTSYEAGQIADETIMYWRNRGVIAAVAWQAMGKTRGQTPSWPRVREYMVRWLLADDAERTITKRAA